MKNKILLLALLLFGLMIGCQEDEYDHRNNFSDTGWYTSLFTNIDMYIGVDNYISFSDFWIADFYDFSCQGWGMYEIFFWEK